MGVFFKDENHPCKTDQLEVLYKEFQPGDKAEAHYHKLKVELLIVLEGKAKYSVNGNKVILGKGDFLFIDANNVISGEFLEPTKIFAIHSPIIVTDKTFIEQRCFSKHQRRSGSKNSASCNQNLVI